MSEKYIAVITDKGKQLQAEAIASSVPVKLTKFVAGDGGGKYVTPSRSQTALINERVRGDIADLKISAEQPNQFIAQLILPAKGQGFTLREAGLLTDAGELYSVASTPAIEKPDGGVAISMNYHFAVSDTDSVTLNVASGEGLFLRVDQNLADVKDTKKSRDNLGLKGAALLNVGMGANTVAAGNDPRIVNALDKEKGGDIKGNVTVKNVLSLGSAGDGVFSGATPGINIGDSDSGFLATGDGVITLYANNAAIGWLDNEGLHINQLNVSCGMMQMTGDDRKHLRFGDADGRTRMYIYKDKGGDGVRINNGDDGGGDFVCQKNGDFWAPGALHAGNASMQTDGNIHGGCWGGYLNIWLNNQLNAVRNTANDAWNKANDAQVNRVTDIRFTAEHQVGAAGVWVYTNGNTVLTGFTNGDGDYSAENLFWSYIQYWRSGQWITVGRS